MKKSPVELDDFLSRGIITADILKTDIDEGDVVKEKSIPESVKGNEAWPIFTRVKKNYRLVTLVE